MRGARRMTYSPLRLTESRRRPRWSRATNSMMKGGRLGPGPFRVRSSLSIEGRTKTAVSNEMVGLVDRTKEQATLWKLTILEVTRSRR
jgi:hypothetical protein